MTSSEGILLEEDEDSDGSEQIDEDYGCQAFLSAKDRLANQDSQTSADCSSGNKSCSTNASPSQKDSHSIDQPLSSQFAK